MSDLRERVAFILWRNFVWTELGNFSDLSAEEVWEDERWIQRISLRRDVQDVLAAIVDTG